MKHQHGLEFPAVQEHLQQDIHSIDDNGAASQGDIHDPAHHIGQRTHRGYTQIAVYGQGDAEGQHQKSQAVNPQPDGQPGSFCLFHGESLLFIWVYRISLYFTSAKVPSQSSVFRGFPRKYQIVK